MFQPTISFDLVGFFMSICKIIVKIFAYVKYYLYLCINNLNNNMECNECDKDWFELNVIPNDQHPLGFNQWCETIQQCKYTIYLPDGSTVYARLFRDNNGRYNDYNYTKYLLNRYKDIYDI